GVAQPAADAPALPEIVGEHGVQLVDPQLGAPVEEAAGEQPCLPVEAVVEGRVDADPQRPWALLLLPGGIEVGRKLDDVPGGEAAGGARVLVAGVVEVEARLELE